MSNKSTKIDWDTISQSPKFKEVYKRRLSFVVPGVATFFLLFFVLFTMQNYWAIADYHFIGYINFAFFYTMMLFPILWIMGLSFCSYTTKKVHPLEDEIVKEFSLKEDKI